METSDWIMSEGGPLVCMEQQLQSSWGGIEEIGVAGPGASNDYDRACQITNYLGDISVPGGSALVIGDAPLDTAFWRSAAGVLLLVRIWHCEPDFDVDAIMCGLDLQIFQEPEELLHFSFASSDLTMFDSADTGRDNQKKFVPFSIKPGQYRISTMPYEPDQLTSLVLHWFEHVG